MSDPIKPEPVTPATPIPTTSTSGEGEDEAAVVKQIEFYFSDANLPYDKFMWSLHTKRPDHWVPIATVAGFKRMSEYKKYDVPWIAKVLRSRGSGLLQVGDDNVNIRRVRDPVPPGASQFENSVYAKGFPDETPELQKQIEAFFETYAPIASVRFRRTDKSEGKKFKNSVFVEFKTKAGAETFLNAEPTPTYAGKELLVMSKDAYIEMKAKEKGFAIPDKTKVLVGNVRKGFNAFKLMADEAKGKASKPKVKSDGDGDEDVAVDAEGESENKERSLVMEGKTYAIAEDGSVDETQLEYPKGKVLKYTGAGDGILDFRKIKASLTEHVGKVTFITKDFEAKDFTSGFAAFEKVMTEEDVSIVQEKVPKICDSAVTWAHASDEDERRFWLGRLLHFVKLKLKSAEGASTSDDLGGGRKSRGGRGSGREGRGGGRGGGRGRGGRGGGKGGGPRGEKRKRDEDGDGEGDAVSGGGETPSNVAATSRGTVPTVTSTSTKKAKLDDGTSGTERPAA